MFASAWESRSRCLTRMLPAIDHLVVEVCPKVSSHRLSVGYGARWIKCNSRTSLECPLDPFERWIDAHGAAGTSESKCADSGRGLGRGIVLFSGMQRVLGIFHPGEREHDFDPNIDKFRQWPYGFGSASFGCGWVGLQRDCKCEWRHGTLRVFSHIRKTAYGRAV